MSSTNSRDSTSHTAIMDKRQERACQDMGNAFPFCAPVSTDVWYNGSAYKFVWNYNYPFYVTYAQLDLHLYYQENFAYEPIKSWNNISRSAGQLPVVVDDSWFPKPVPPGSANQTWTMFGYYLPAGMNASQEIADTSSMFPTPFNFSAVQFASTTSINNGTNDRNSPNNGGDTNSSGNSNDSGSHLPGWSIAVIVIACIAFVVAVAAIIWGVVVFRRIRNRNENSSDPSPRPNDPKPSAMTENNPAQETARLSPLDVGSVHSSTPMAAAAALRASMSPRSSGGDSNAAPSRPTIPFDSTRTQTSSDTADKFHNLLQNPLWSGQPGEEAEEELRRRKLGEALLQRELAEEGTSVKHAERRPLTVRMVPEPESTQVVMERQDNP